jgi:uridylate kinase
MSELPKRVLLKISGEALAGLQPSDDQKTGIDQRMLQKVAADIKQVYDLGIQVCLVVGGGNIYRGVSGMESCGIDRSTGDYMGMLATVINGMALKNILEKTGMDCRMMTAIPMPVISEPYTFRRALHHLNKERVVLFSAGTGNPFFTTDTAAALRASEMGCDLLLKATKVKGVYSSDPMKDSSAVFLEHLTYTEVIERNLNVMDTAAISLTRDNSIPIAVFSIYEADGFRKVVTGETQFTLISHK